MPWCEDCSKFWNPNTIPPDGTCPTCHRIIADPPDTRVPWHFWLLVAGLVLYLGWRVIQGFQWLIGNEQYAWAAVAGVVLAASCGWGGYYALQREPDEEPSESEPS